MRITLIIDENLLAQAVSISGVTSRRKLVHQALKGLIERESARRLARLGGSEPSLRALVRRRPAGLRQAARP
ncbi:MAG: type II toxin-antitoxin system VapB family antitoxin [Alphaproteobacteria bacterium]|nr:type II toxin-antitoxin system VapB family antitoxin [Alphaproteobacteria bacterium]